MSDVTSLLEVKDLRVIRGKNTILDIAALTIRKGEVLCLIGPNGAGKTTLLQVLSRLAKPSAGQMTFRGNGLRADSEVLHYRRKIAMVFQEALLFDTTVFGNVASGLKIRGMQRAEIGRRAAEQLERFGIAHLSERSARTLSGGEAQRTSLARALATQPEILFLDEPFSSLDPPTRDSLMNDLEKILRETDTTAVMATHDRLEALRLSDRIAVMMGGRIVQIGTSDSIMNHPADESVAAFVGIETILKGRALKSERGTTAITVAGLEIEVVGDASPGETVILCIRPENVTLATGLSGEPTSARNVFRGRVQRILPAGLFYKVHLDCGFPLIAYITKPALEDLSLREGSGITASFKATAIHLIRRREPSDCSGGHRD